MGRLNRDEPTFVPVDDILVLRRGDHLAVEDVFLGLQRYFHHAICLGGGIVVHYSGPPPNNWKKAGVTVRMASLDQFAEGRKMFRLEYERCFPPDEVAKRAATLFSDASSLGWGPGSYHLFRRNCEHFANLCKTGSDRSRQIDASFGSLYPLWNAMKFMCIM